MKALDGRIVAASVLLAFTFLAGCLGAATDMRESETAQRRQIQAPRFSTTHVFQGTYDLSAYPRPLQDGIFKIGASAVTKLKSSLDGAEIDVGWVLPDVPADQRVPVIAVVTPYNAPLSASTVLNEGMGKLFAETFIPHGYAYAVVSVRGTGDSGGCMDYMGPREVADTDQAITWLGTQPWSNGNVAMIGVSYDGSTPWEPAAKGNPHLKTIVPIAGINDYWLMNYRNGTPTVFGLGYEFTGYYALPAALSPASGKTANNVVSQAACVEAMKSAYAGYHSAVLGERDPLGFWGVRNLRPAVLENYKGSVFMIHGLWDDNVGPAQAYPFVNELEDRGVVVKHLVAQWGHQYPGSKPPTRTALRPDFHEILWRWFEHELKGRTDLDLGPGAQVQDSGGAWRSEDSWPPRNATTTTFFLTPDGVLASTPASARGTAIVTARVPTTVSQGYAPQDFWYRPATTLCASCPTFRTPVLEEDFRFAGLPLVHVTVTALGPGGYVAAHLYAENPQGQLHYLGQGGGINLHFADGTETRRQVLPGQSLLAKMQLEPMDAVVPAGSRLVLVLHQGGYGDHYPPPADTIPLRLEVGGEQSRLVVRSFERGEDAFFVPPGASR